MRQAHHVSKLVRSVSVLRGAGGPRTEGSSFAKMDSIILNIYRICESLVLARPLYLHFATTYRVREDNHREKLIGAYEKRLRSNRYCESQGWIGQRETAPIQS